jgi:hypothetical protein
LSIIIFYFYIFQNNYFIECRLLPIMLLTRSRNNVYAYLYHKHQNVGIRV